MSSQALQTPEKSAWLLPVAMVGASMFGITSAFSLSSWLNWSVIGVSILGFCAAIEIVRGRIDFGDGYDVILTAVGMLLAVAISMALSNVSVDEKAWNHFFARNFTIVFLFLLPSILLRSNALLVFAVKKGLVLTAWLSIFLILYDFLRLNGYLDLGAVPHLFAGEELDATHRVDIYRARGGSIEPGHDASVIAAILPLMVDRIREKFRLAFICLIAAIVYFMGYSTSLVLWLLVFSLVYSVLLSGVSLHGKVLAVARVFGMAVFLFFAFDYFGIIEDLETKIFSSSYEDRIGSFIDIASGVAENGGALLFGYGPGGYLASGVSMVTNTFSGWVLDSGLLGLFFYLCAILLCWRRLLLCSDPLYMAAFIAYLSVFVMAIGNYWFPTHWLFLLYPIFSLSNREREIKSDSTGRQFV